MKHIILFLGLVIAGFLSTAQPSFEPYSVILEEVSIDGAPALQSYAWATSGTKWLLAGGVTNGLHDHRPPFSFQAVDRNTNLFVVDYASGAVWAAALSGLPDPVAEQLASTNMQFVQADDQLFIFGGYGYDATVADWVTHPGLIVVDVPGVMAAIQAGQSLTPYIRRLENEVFAVTGGQAGYLDGEFYLVGGQWFEGRYNPHNGPSFVQEYTNAIRRFRIEDVDGQLSLADYSETVDAGHLHRRDYNMLPQVFPDGTPGFTVFTGVFRPDIDLPWLNTVDVGAGGYSVIADFEQLFNQYHTAHLPLYDAAYNVMHNHFFGGIGLYYADEEGNVMLDSLVPFTRSVSRVTRHADGSLSESLLELQMPDLLGASAEFIHLDGVPKTANGVIDLQALPDEPALVGHIYGGIESSQPNIFMQMTGSSQATKRIFRVWIHKGVSGVAYQVTPPQTGLIGRCYPNPASDTLLLEGEAQPNDLLKVQLRDLKGRTVREQELKTRPDGAYETRLRLQSLPSGLYFLSVRSDQATETRRVIVE